MADVNPLKLVDLGDGQGQLREMQAGDKIPGDLLPATEWTAETVSQAEAEAGASEARRAWTSQRVRQAILGWWNGATSVFGRGFVAAADAAAGRTALGLVAAATEATPSTLVQRDSAGSLRAFETVQTGAQIRAYPSTSPEIRTFKSVVAWNSNANPATGTIKITLPFSWTSSMLIISISGFNYSAISSSWSLLLSGFNLSSGAWSNCSASTSATPPPFTSVRFGHDGTRCCILLGVTTTSMVFPKLVIDRVVVTNAQTGLAWGQGWSIEQITSEAGITVSATPAIFGLTANPNVLAAYTLATLPSAAANPRLQVYCSNLTGQPAPVFSNGSNWRRVSDNTIAD